MNKSGSCRGLGRAAITLAACFCFIGISSALGQIPGINTPSAKSSPASADDKTIPNSLGTNTPAKDLSARLTEARAHLSDGNFTNAPAGVSAQDIWTRRALLSRLVRLYEQQISSATELESAQARRSEVLRESQAWTRFAEPLPYSIRLADGLREELQAEELKLSKGDSALKAMNQIVEANRKALVLAEEKIRQFNETLEHVKDAALAARLAWQRELERLRSQVSAATVGLLEAERLVREEDLAASRTRLALLQRKRVIADAGANFTQADLNEVTSQLEREREQTETELADAQNKRTTALDLLKASREKFQLTKERPDATSAEISGAVEEVSLREAQLETANAAIRSLRLVLEGGNIERTMWELRFAAYGSHSAEVLSDSERRLAMFTRRLDLWRDQQRQQLEIASSQIQVQETHLNSLTPDSELRPIAQERLAALKEREQFLMKLVRTMERVERLSLRCAESLQAAEHLLPITGRVQSLFSGAHSFLQSLWTFEVFTAEDTITVDGQRISGKRSITIGKIVMALLILVVGYWLTGLISFIVEPIFIKRLKIEPNQANLIRRWVRAMLLVCLAVFSLVSVKIPLTVFAFAGGALAIALGFGMQTILKNLVSGLIILFERPFRVGDVLDVSGNRGTITSVGLRASVLQLWDGTETLIPNSALLENNLTNWTYSNRRVRFTVTVGVAYGSDPRLVIQVLNEVADRHGLVEKEPKPQVLFTEFGDSTLGFELRFWVDVSRANAAQVSSDLRLMIAGSFAEHGIVIDYPQRSLHLHAARPITVEIVASKDNSSPSGIPANGPSSQAAGQRLSETRAAPGKPL